MLICLRFQSHVDPDLLYDCAWSDQTKFVKKHSLRKCCLQNVCHAGTSAFPLIWANLQRGCLENFKTFPNDHLKYRTQKSSNIAVDRTNQILKVMPLVEHLLHHKMVDESIKTVCCSTAPRQLHKNVISILKDSSKLHWNRGCSIKCEVSSLPSRRHFQWKEHHLHKRDYTIKETSHALSILILFFLLHSFGIFFVFIILCLSISLIRVLDVCQAIFRAIVRRSPTLEQRNIFHSSSCFIRFLCPQWAIRIFTL